MTPYTTDLQRAKALRSTLLLMLSEAKNCVVAYGQAMDSHKTPQIRRCLVDLLEGFKSCEDSISDDLQHGVIHLLQCEEDDYDDDAYEHGIHRQHKLDEMRGK